jgi:glycosyltransferase involved in cell wall biosynthesis
MQQTQQQPHPHVAVVIPAYKVRNHILGVIANLGSEVTTIIVIDDLCPEFSGQYVSEQCGDERVSVINHAENKGVGGAVMTGYKEALRRGADIIVKIDGDGQMDPRHLPKLITPILKNQADYTKGNRFFNIEKLGRMPFHRIIGNAGLSFLSKLSTGYWSVFDPNNGYTAIRANSLKNLPLEKIANRYFFESDMLFRLNIIRASVRDIPLDAIYEDEVSSLSAFKSLFEFTYKHLKNLFKRIFYNYFLREFSLASLHLVFGSALLIFGVVFGAKNWIHSMNTGIATNVGALVMISMAVLSGIQMLLSFFSYDISNEPKHLMNP